MILIQRRTNRETLYLSTNSAFPEGENETSVFDTNIKPYHPELVSLVDLLFYKLHDINNKAKVLNIVEAGKREIQVDANGNVIGCLTWPRVTISITGLMQLTVSNGGINDDLLDLPLVDRQVNLTADPIYDTLIEIAIIRNTATGAVDVGYIENNGPLTGGWELVQMLLKFTLPAGTTDLNSLGLL